MELVVQTVLLSFTVIALGNRFHKSAVHIRSSNRPRSKLAQFENGCRCLDWMNEQDQATTHRLARIRVGLKSSIWILALLFIKNKQVGMTHASAVFRLDDY
jgi:hypothetical protein